MKLHIQEIFSFQRFSTSNKLQEDLLSGILLCNIINNQLCLFEKLQNGSCKFLLPVYSHGFWITIRRYSLSVGREGRGGEGIKQWKMQQFHFPLFLQFSYSTFVLKTSMHQVFPHLQIVILLCIYCPVNMALMLNTVAIYKDLLASQRESLLSKYVQDCTIQNRKENASLILLFSKMKYF